MLSQRRPHNKKYDNKKTKILIDRNFNPLGCPKELHGIIRKRNPKVLRHFLDIKS